MGTDDDIHQPLFQILNGLFLLRSRTKTAQQIHPHRKIFHSLYKSIVVLLSQDRGRYQIHHLPVFLHRLKSRANSDLRLSISHIAADQTIHDLCALHIPLRIFDGLQLILGLFKGKHFLKFLLPHRIRSVGKTIRLLAGCIQAYQLPGDIFDRAFDLCLGFVPFLTAQLIERRFLGIRTGIFLQRIQLGGKDIQGGFSCIFDFNIIFDNSVVSNFLDTTVYAQAMIFMYYIITHMKFGKILDLLSGVFLFFSFFLFLPAKNIRVRDHQKFQKRIFIAPMGMPLAYQDLSRLHLPCHILRVKAVKPLVPQIFRKPHGSGAGST